MPNRGNKKKVIIVSDFYQPFIGYSKVVVAQKLINSGHSLKVLTSNKFFPFPNYETTVGSVLGNRERKVGFRKEEGIPIERKQMVFELFSRGLFFGIEDTIKKYKPDVVIVYVIASFSSIQVAKLKKKYNYQLVLVDTHLPSEFERGNKILKSIFYGSFRILFSKLISNSADKIIAAQEGTIDIIKNVYGIKKKVHLIDQGTDLDKFFFAKKEREILRRKFKLSEKDFVIIYPGKVIAAKGVHLLFEAFGELAKKHKNIYLCIVGSGEKDYIKKCKAVVSKKYHNRLIWVDFQPQEELYKYYSFSDLGVWPLQEALSMNDCAACERPFIAMDEITSKKRLKNDNALLYKKGNVEDLIEKIQYLYKHPKERKAMGKRGRELVEKELSWDKIAQKYIDV
jgi:glycosyltransferase involved in cell wall biosynthesis